MKFFMTLKFHFSFFLAERIHGDHVTYRVMKIKLRWSAMWWQNFFATNKLAFLIAYVTFYVWNDCPRVLKLELNNHRVVFGLKMHLPAP